LGSWDGYVVIPAPATSTPRETRWIPAEIAVDLGVEGSFEHPPGTLAGQLLERLADRRLAARDDRLGRVRDRPVRAGIDGRRLGL
jgi:hypothetical protein